MCAAVTSVSCLVHRWVAVSGFVLAAVCVPCAVHIWQHSNARGAGRAPLTVPVSLSSELCWLLSDWS